MTSLDMARMTRPYTGLTTCCTDLYILKVNIIGFYMFTSYPEFYRNSKPMTDEVGLKRVDDEVHTAPCEPEKFGFI